MADNLKDFFLRFMHSSDPEILYLIGASIVQDWSKPKTLPTSVKGLLLNPEKYNFSDVAADLVIDLDFDLDMAFEEVVEGEDIEVIEIDD